MAKGTVNKVIILGRLGQDPEVKQTQSGTSVANLNVATTEVGAKDQSGQRQELTEWHRVTLWGKTAEIAGQYLAKGSQVYIEGRLQTRKWQDQNGQDRYTTEIVGNEMQFIGGRNDNMGGQGFAPQQHQPQGGFQQAPHYNNQAPQPDHPAGGGIVDFDDDVPF